MAPHTRHTGANIVTGFLSSSATCASLMAWSKARLHEMASRHDSISHGSLPTPAALPHSRRRPAHLHPRRFLEVPALTRFRWRCIRSFVPPAPTSWWPHRPEFRERAGTAPPPLRWDAPFRWPHTHAGALVRGFLHFRLPTARELNLKRFWTGARNRHGMQVSTTIRLRRRVSKDDGVQEHRLLCPTRRASN